MTMKKDNTEDNLFKIEKLNKTVIPLRKGEYIQEFQASGKSHINQLTFSMNSGKKFKCGREQEGDSIVNFNIP